MVNWSHGLLLAGLPLALGRDEHSLLPSKDYAALSVYTFTFLLGLPANVLVLIVYARKAHKRGATPNVVYALNLCVANLVLVAWLPVKALETLLQDWRLPAPVCPVFSFFLFSSLYGSCLFLTAVATGRYLSIAFPIVYKRYRRARISCFISGVLWLAVLLHLSFALAAERGANFVSTEDDTSACYVHFNGSQLAVLLPLRLEMAVVCFLLPLTVTSFCTLRCVTLVWRSNLRPAGKRRVLAVALSTLAVFVVCYAPYNASHVVGFASNANVGWRTYALLTSFFNVFLEPAVMLMLSPVVGRICGRQSQLSRDGRRRYRRNSTNGGANARAPHTVSERSQAGGEVTRESQEKAGQCDTHGAPDMMRSGVPPPHSSKGAEVGGGGG